MVENAVRQKFAGDQHPSDSLCFESLLNKVVSMCASQPDLFAKLLDQLSVREALQLEKYLRFLPRAKLNTIQIALSHHLLLQRKQQLRRDFSVSSREAILKHLEETLNSI